MIGRDLAHNAICLDKVSFFCLEIGLFKVYILFLNGVFLVFFSKTFAGGSKDIKIGFFYNFAKLSSSWQLQ